MKYVLYLAILQFGFSQNIINSYTGGSYLIKAEHLFNLPQIFGINALQFHANYNTIDNAYIMPSRLGFTKKGGVSLQVPLEYPYDIEKLFDVDQAFLDQENSALNSFTINDSNQYSPGSATFSESVALRIPDLAVFYPMKHFGLYLSNQTVLKLNSQISNQNTAIEIQHIDSDPNLNFVYNSGMSTSTDADFQTSIYSFGGVFQLSNTSSLAVGVGLVNNSIQVRSLSRLDDARIQYNLLGVNRTTRLTNLKSVYDIDESSMKTQFTLHYSNIPKVDTLNEYQTNAHLELVLKTPITASFDRFLIEQRTLPNFIDGEDVDASLFNPDQAGVTREINMYANDFKIHYPGIFAFAIRFPFGNSSYGAQVSFPIGKFGVEYSKETVEQYTAADSTIVSETESKEKPLYLDNRFGFSFSYGYMIPEWNELNFNLNLMAYFIEPYYGQDFESNITTADRYLLPMVTFNLSAKVMENIYISFNGTFPETTILKTNLTYSF